MRSGRILHKDECYEIQGAAFEVYREMGCGFLEAVYQECLERELATRDIPLKPKPELALQYKNSTLLQKYQPDLICHNRIIVELKAVREIALSTKLKSSTTSMLPICDWDY